MMGFLGMGNNPMVGAKAIQIQSLRDSDIQKKTTQMTGGFR